jgi:uncharacterized Zn finger protein
MTTCPECSSSDTTELGTDESNDGQGFWWRITYSYSCDECGCEWEETETTTKEISIAKHGKEVD